MSSFPARRLVRPVVRSRRLHVRAAFRCVAPLLVTLACAAAASTVAGQSLVVSHVAGSDGGPGSNDGPLATARFHAPFDLVFDAAGTLYVLDTYNHTMRKVTAGGVTTFVGLPGQAGSADGTGPFARFTLPQAVAADASGNLFVADSGNHTIRRVTPAGVVTTFAGSAGQAGSTDATGAAARFKYPVGIAVDGSGNLYVADSANYTIRKITTTGVVTTLAGLAGQSDSVDATGSAARFRMPVYLDVDTVGNVFVADMSGPTIRRVTPGGVVTTLAGKAGESGSVDGTGTDARFDGPVGIVADAAGNLFVSDDGTWSSKVRRVTASGVVTTLAGGELGTADGPAASARFLASRGLALDALGALYVADTWNHAIRRMGADQSVTTVVGRPSAWGAADGQGTGARFGPQLMGSSRSPYVFWEWAPDGANDHGGLTVDASGNAYVADTRNYAIRAVRASGAVTTLAGGQYGSADGAGANAKFGEVEGIAAGRDGTLYVADSSNHTIRRVSRAGHVTTLAGLAGQSGSVDGTGSDARFYGPRGVAVDDGGTVYVADTFNCTVRRITPGGEVTTLAGAAGECGATDGWAASARFQYPRGLAVDRAGTIYVADTGSATVRAITPGGLVTTVAGLAGQRGVVDGVGSAARFFFLAAISVSPAGGALVADADYPAAGGYRPYIRRVTSTGVVTTLAGGDAQTAQGTGGAARLRTVVAIAADRAGSAYALDAACLRKATPGPRRFETYTPADIPDEASVDSPIEVDGVTGVVEKVTVSVRLVHTYTADLALSLVGPDGTTVLLSSHNGGTGDDYGSATLPDSLRTTFDDAATTSITVGAAPFGGAYQPQEPLSPFAGKSGSGVNGTWRLRVADDARGDVGVVAAWGLDLHLRAPHLTSVTPAAASASGGTVLTITGTDIGTWPWPDVRIGGVPATVQAVAPDGTWIQVVAPALPGGPATIAVTNADGQSAFLPSAFTARAPYGSDFDGDHHADVAVYRPGAGTWFWLKSTTSNTTYGSRGWGVQAAGDVPAAGDFDGDRIVDPTVFRPSTGTWYILRSLEGYTRWDWFGWGTTGDVPVPGDYDGDAITDGAVFRPSTGAWYVRPSSDPARAWTVTFGAATDVPVSGDYDGDGKTDIAVYRPTYGTWFVLTSSSGYVSWSAHGWGVQAHGDTPVPGDYDGDGKTDVTVYRPAAGTWFVLKSSSNNTQWTYFGWGAGDDRPMPADYDGDGTTDGAIFRPSTGEWYVRPSSGAASWKVTFGVASDVRLTRAQ